MLATLTPIQTARIKEAANLATVVGEYVRLRPAGTDTFVGLCPFHNEKSPSFKVHPAKGYYKCFGCGVTGDAITFARQMQGLSFPAAARALADQYGVSLTDTPQHVTREQMAHARQLAVECAWWWARVRRACHFRFELMKALAFSYSERVTRTVRREELFCGCPGDDVYFEEMYQKHARRAARWGRILRRMESVKPPDLFARFRRYQRAHAWVDRDWAIERAANAEIEKMLKVAVMGAGEEQLIKVLAMAKAVTLDAWLLNEVLGIAAGGAA